MSARLPRDCERTRERLPEYADGSLVGAAKLAAARHLETCARCAAELADLRAVISAARAVPQEDPPEHLVARVSGAVRDQAPAVPQQFWVRLAIPAAVLTGLVAVTFALRPPYQRGLAPPQLSRERTVVAEGPAAGAEFSPGLGGAQLDTLQQGRASEEPAPSDGDEADALRQPTSRPDVADKERATAGGMAGGGRSRGGRGSGGVRHGRGPEAPPARRGAAPRGGAVTEAREEDLTQAYDQRDQRIAADRATSQQKAASPRPHQEAEGVRPMAEPSAAMPLAKPPVTTTITVVKGATGENLLALQLRGERPIRELSLKVGEGTPTAHQWVGDADRPALIPLPGERIGAGPAAVPLAVVTDEGRGEYVLFVPTLSRLGESAPQAPAGRWQATDVERALLELSMFTGLVILAEQPLTAELSGDIPAGTPGEVLQQLATEAGFQLQQEGAVAYTLTHLR